MSEVLERWRWYIVALIAVPMLVGVGMLLEEELDGPSPLVIEPGELSADVRVYVVGAVEAPGVYPLEAGSRWVDAVAAAGGATAEADLTAINLSRHARSSRAIPSLHERRRHVVECRAWSRESSTRRRAMGWTSPIGRWGKEFPS